jgi:FAD/FMN-containing dehydrogenase
VRLDPAARTVTAQGGCRGGDLDAALAPHGLCAVAGTTNHTGVGGVTLGGGYGWLTGQYGLMVDNLVAVRVVLAGGEVVVAREGEIEELFLGVRGAGWNFGVVVELMYRVHEMGHDVYCGYVLFAPEKLRKVVEFMSSVPAGSGGRAGAGMLFGCVPGSSTPTIGCLIFFNGSLEEGEGFFAPLLAVGPFHNTVA